MEGHAGRGIRWDEMEERAGVGLLSHSEGGEDLEARIWRGGETVRRGVKRQ